MKHYLITCRDCNATREVGIIASPMGDRIDWLDNKPNDENIVSGRPRLDGQYGWQCLCGNNDLMTAQEKKFIGKDTSPPTSTIAELMKEIEPAETKFIMETV